MTFQELYQLKNLKQEITEQQQRLDKLRDKATSTRNRSESVPSGGDPDKTGRIVVEIAMAESVIKKELSEYWRMYVELETYINNIPDSFTRRIFRMRFIDGLTWGKIAMTIGGNQTSDSVRKICKRFLNNEEKH